MKNLYRFFMILFLAFFTISFSFIGNVSVGKELPKIDAITTFAPDVPPPIKRNYPAYVVVKFETIE